MPTGPRGEKRPADVIGNTVHVVRIATGEEVEELLDDGKDPAADVAGSPPSFTLRVDVCGYRPQMRPLKSVSWRREMFEPRS
jgi:hypothetical protein